MSVWCSGRPVGQVTFINVHWRSSTAVNMLCTEWVFDVQVDRWAKWRSWWTSLSTASCPMMWSSVEMMSFRYTTRLRSNTALTPPGCTLPALRYTLVWHSATANITVFSFFKNITFQVWNLTSAKWCCSDCRTVPAVYFVIIIINYYHHHHHHVYIPD